MYAQRYAARAEDFLQRAQGKIHVEDIERLFVAAFHKLHVSLAVVLLHGAAQLPVFVLRGREHEGCGYVGVAQARVDYIHARGRVVVGHGGDVAGGGKVVGKLRRQQFLIVCGYCRPYGHGQRRAVGGSGWRRVPRGCRTCYFRRAILRDGGYTESHDSDNHCRCQS